MKKIILIFMLLVCSGSVISDNDLPKTILIINSYNESYNWTRNMMNGIMDNLDDSLDVRVEYLDAKNYNSPSYFQDLYNLFIKKYNGVDFDAIITSDDYAFQFVTNHRDELFKDIPLFFSGINSFSTYDDNIYNNIYGLNEAPSYIETIEIAKKLNPNLENIHFIIDNSISGQIAFDEMKKQLIDENLVTYQGQSLDEILSQLKKIDNPNDIILLSYFIVDSDGRFYDTSTMTQIIKEAVNIPIYGLYEFSLDHGIIGGKLISGYEQGKRSVEIMYNYFAGEYDTYHIESFEVNLFKFDYTYMEEFNYDINKLPEDAIIINKPLTFFEKHRVIINWSLFIIFILMLYIGILRKQVKSQTKKYILVNQQLNEVDKLASLGEMMYRISHELNTPLGISITSGSHIYNINTHLMKSLDENKLTKHQLQSALESINKSSAILNTSLSTANELMSAFRIFSEHNEDDTTTRFDLSAYMTNLVKTYTPIINPNNHTIELQVPDQLIIFGKTSDYYYIINHLIQNSLQHAFKGLRDKKISIKITKEKNRLIIHFEDNGHGIPKEHLDHIFEPMYRLSSSRHFVLGLSSVNKIVVSLKGKITCSSEHEKGTTFIINLPIKKRKSIINL